MEYLRADAGTFPFAKSSSKASMGQIEALANVELSAVMAASGSWSPNTIATAAMHRQMLSLARTLRPLGAAAPSVSSTRTYCWVRTRWLCQGFAATLGSADTASTTVGSMQRRGSRSFLASLSADKGCRAWVNHNEARVRGYLQLFSTPLQATVSRLTQAAPRCSYVSALVQNGEAERSSQE